ncbi:NUDIX domain-containing protein [Xanthovirga aplysinae]|uniref:NUDIX domain-containing protein n=1 Tax=Xanthovirga aplysinae TaxID=2529853 RepID=UPI0012BD6DDA|nr:NUDIX hydrolase [Xanthovirga aplysinae]MTI30337.1 NUDIX hydrolase [Xanthovirga aplysinae]
MYTYPYPRPSVTADCVVLNFTEDQLHILLIQRANEPFKGKWALPGGFMEMEETTKETAERELKEETGLQIKDFLEIGVFDQPHRDPRGRVITLAYLTIIQEVKLNLSPASDAKSAHWFSVKDLPNLAFDHLKIIQKAFQKLIGLLEINRLHNKPFFHLSREAMQVLSTQLKSFKH